MMWNWFLGFEENIIPWEGKKSSAKKLCYHRDIPVFNTSQILSTKLKLKFAMMRIFGKGNFLKRNITYFHLATISLKQVIDPWTQNVNWTHKRHSESVQDVF